MTVVVTTILLAALWPDGVRPRLAAVAHAAAHGNLERARFEAESPEFPPAWSSLARAIPEAAAWLTHHDTVALARAADLLLEASRRLGEPTNASGRFARCLVLTQKAWVDAQRGNRFNAALHARRAYVLGSSLEQEGFDDPDLDGVLGAYRFWTRELLGGAAALAGWGNSQDAIDQARRAVHHDGVLLEGHRTSLVWMLARQNSVAEALLLVEDGLRLHPRNPVHLQARGDMLARLGRCPEALAAYRTAHAAVQGTEVVAVHSAATTANLFLLHRSCGFVDSAAAWRRLWENTPRTIRMRTAPTLRRSLREAGVDDP